MADKLEGPAKEILEEPSAAVLSIPRKDGTVQSVVVWAHTADGEVTVNSAEGRAWPANLRRAKTATVTALREGNPFEFVSVTGSLAGEAGEPEAGDHINMLAKKYIGADVYPYRQEGEQRIKFRLKPERVNYFKSR
jgi:PPOX class probable F420-dependent enzyme